MIPYFDKNLSVKYKNPSQIIRVLSEEWTLKNIFCPNCGDVITKLANNYPAGDFYCKNCTEIFELKSKRNFFGKLITDGAYKVMSDRIINNTAPNLFMLNYNFNDYRITNFFVIPRHFFTIDLLVKRKPLSNRARRANWVGCNIIIGNIPKCGKIYYLKNHKLQSKDNVVNNWKKTLFLRKEYRLRGWTLEIMNCIDKLDQEEFYLNELYKYESYLKSKYPENKHIRDKIRQQLQFLRDKGYLIFLKRGKYKRNFET